MLIYANSPPKAGIFSSHSLLVYLVHCCIRKVTTISGNVSPRFRSTQTHAIDPKIVFFLRQAKSDENCKIYLKGLPWDTPDEDITAFFKACGKIESVDQPKNPDGRSSGTAYVVFDSAASAGKAVEMDGQEIGGRWLKIMMSFEKPEHARNGEQKPKPEGCTTVFIGNLSWSIDEVRASLLDVFFLSWFPVVLVPEGHFFLGRLAVWLCCSLSLL